MHSAAVYFNKGTIQGGNHKSTRDTEIYTPILPAYNKNIRSPLDDLGEILDLVAPGDVDNAYPTPHTAMEWCKYQRYNEREKITIIQFGILRLNG